MELVSMRISDENVSGVRNVNSIWKIGDGLATDSPKKIPIFMHHHDAVSLEVTNIIFMPKYGNVRGLGHIFRAFDILNQFATFMQNENGRSHRVHCDDKAYENKR